MRTPPLAVRGNVILVRRRCWEKPLNQTRQESGWSGARRCNPDDQQVLRREPPNDIEVPPCQLGRNHNGVGRGAPQQQQVLSLRYLAWAVEIAVVAWHALVAIK